MSKQWGHGFHKGVEAGFSKGEYAHANGETFLKLSDLIWAAQNITSIISERLYSQDPQEFQNIRFLIVSLETLYREARRLKMRLDKKDNEQKTITGEEA